MPFFTVRHALTMSMGLALATAVGGPASAKYKVLYTFCADQQTCADGSGPPVGLTGDYQGNFYGITSAGGANGFGTIFKLAKAGKRFAYHVLYSFAACTQDSCPDGTAPAGELALDTTGNLYGAMSRGAGGSVLGNLFELTAGGQYRMLYAFCSLDKCVDGRQPLSPLTYPGDNTGALYDGVSPLYGTTVAGGDWDGGLAYSFTPGADRPQTLFSFCALTQHDNCSSGEGPMGPLAVSASKTLYGATLNESGDTPGGLLWSVDPHRTLHHFCPGQPDNPCQPGAPAGPLGVALDPDTGALYGTTITGGGGNQGVAFSYDTSTRKFSTLRSFPDGENPRSILYPDGMGGVLGVAGGGAHGGGVLYRIDLTTKKLKTLYDFCQISEPYCADGAGPVGRVVPYSGSIFGVTAGGGGGLQPGVIYQYTP